MNKKAYRLFITSLILAFFVVLPKSINAQDTTQINNNLTREDVAFVMKIFDGQQISDILPKIENFISTGKTTEEKAFIAAAVFDYYLNSKIMGYDEIALHIADNYFLNNKYVHPNQDEFLMMKLFAEYNRMSMIGLNAPELNLEDITGKYISLRESKGDYTILLFYDDKCNSCKKQIPLIMEYLEDVNKLNITLYRVYTQSNRNDWKEYVDHISKQYTLPSNIKVFDLWDPEIESNYNKLYGVVSTPQLFLLNSENVIIGRGLTPKALTQVIDLYNGQPSNWDLIFDNVFQPIVSSKVADTTKIIEAIDTFFEDSKDNISLFNELFFSLYQYLKNQNDYDLQKGAAYLGKKYIVNMSKMWEGVIFTNQGKTSGNTIRAEYPSVQSFINETALAVELFNRNRLGDVVTDLLLTSSDRKKISIRGIESDYTVLYFYSTSCDVCEAVSAEMKGLYDTFASKGVTFVGILAGKDKKWKKYLKSHQFEWINLQDKDGKSGMFQKYDLVDVPAIYLLDKKKITLAKDITPGILKQLLEYLVSNENK